MKFAKRLVCAALAASAMLSCAPAFAADTPAKAAIWGADEQDFTYIMVEGQETECWNGAGKESYFLSYGGAVYVSVHAAAGWMGKELAVSPDGKTFALSGTKAPVYRTDGESIYQELTYEQLLDKLVQPVSVTLLSDARLVLDGSTVSLTDAAGKPAAMLSWDGEAYLPIRSVAQLLGMDVKYYEHVKENEAQEGSVKVKSTYIFLRTAMTDIQLQACKDYYTALETVADSYLELYSEISGSAPVEDIDAKVTQALAYMQTLRDTPKPDCRLLDVFYADLQSLTGDAIKSCELVKQMIRDNEDPEKIKYIINEDWTGETFGMYEDNLSDNPRGLRTVCSLPCALIHDIRIAIYESIE